MASNSLPKSFHVCATCALWGGTRYANPTRSLATFDTHEKGECLGGGFNHLKMSPMATCHQWQGWTALR
jgi:hypothetical protein